ncbi:hypothetical protein COV56_02715 [Candidatus Kuenenbacteria bacterium CG11_big_fil_rev_8_21_14_0_20_37_9]|nr:MAG: hypothetical protein COV56_02715 [Candidatus Kuenenbacteria bacterium CG11_big_fil_rev_8_21_14_0_20_37_9]
MSNGQQNFIFSEEQISNFVGFGNTLKKIHKRLVSEGYKIKNGEIIPPQKNNVLPVVSGSIFYD